MQQFSKKTISSKDGPAPFDLVLDQNKDQTKQLMK